MVLWTGSCLTALLNKWFNDILKPGEQPGILRQKTKELGWFVQVHKGPGVIEVQPAILCVMPSGSLSNASESAPTPAAGSVWAAEVIVAIAREPGSSSSKSAFQEPFATAAFPCQEPNPFSPEWQKQPFPLLLKFPSGQSKTFSGKGCDLKAFVLLLKAVVN
ncbi:hypothetical protein Anapl_13308 [Anas platyrhynchos]|uniref:Uncharacterized protein n=1 Tax=Anas platyrhynchos TaxID=8839 RepID=R0M031_ANAPL|nr:hypothetical protein Anapl_13308 [Anas platyrhynchos]